MTAKEADLDRVGPTPRATHTNWNYKVHTKALPWAGIISAIVLLLVLFAPWRDQAFRASTHLDDAQKHAAQGAASPASFDSSRRAGNGQGSRRLERKPLESGDIGLRPSRIRGTAKTTHGTPLYGAQIVARPLGGAWLSDLGGYLHDAFVATDGSFEIDGLVANTEYQIRILPFPHKVFSLESEPRERLRLVVDIKAGAYGQVLWNSGAPVQEAAVFFGDGPDNGVLTDRLGCYLLESQTSEDLQSPVRVYFLGGKIEFRRQVDFTWWIEKAIRATPITIPERPRTTLATSPAGIPFSLWLLKPVERRIAMSPDGRALAVPSLPLPPTTSTRYVAQVKPEDDSAAVLPSRPFELGDEPFLEVDFRPARKIRVTVNGYDEGPVLVSIADMFRARTEPGGTAVLRIPPGMDQALVKVSPAKLTGTLFEQVMHLRESLSIDVPEPAFVRFDLQQDDVRWRPLLRLSAEERVEWPWLRHDANIDSWRERHETVYGPLMPGVYEVFLEVIDIETRRASPRRVVLDSGINTVRLDFSEFQLTRARWEDLDPEATGFAPEKINIWENQPDSRFWSVFSSAETGQVALIPWGAEILLTAARERSDGFLNASCAKVSASTGGISQPLWRTRSPDVMLIDAKTDEPFSGAVHLYVENMPHVGYCKVQNGRLQISGLSGRVKVRLDASRTATFDADTPHAGVKRIRI